MSFIEVPASKKSLGNRRPIYGVGINDADYMTQYQGERCPYYMAWKSMIRRCYSKECHLRSPTYIGCSVHKDWHVFSTFKDWMKQQDWKNNSLDKDLLNPGNRVYAEGNCIFVSARINALFNNNKASRGAYPEGVYLQDRGKKFVAEVGVNSKRSKYLGLFDTPEEAREAYINAKHKIIVDIANEQDDPRLKNGLLKHAQLLINEVNNVNHTQRNKVLQRKLPAQTKNDMQPIPGQPKGRDVIHPVQGRDRVSL